LVATAPLTLRLLIGTLGIAGTRHLLARFNASVPPGYTAIDEARAFLPFAAHAAAMLPGIEETVAADAAALC
jgi:hypothetical protein